MKNLSLNFKIMIVLGILVAGGVAISYSGISRMSMIMRSLKEIAGSIVKRDQLTSEILLLQRDMLLNNKDVILETSPERMAAITQKVADIRSKLIGTVEEYEKIASSEEKEMLSRYRAELKTLIEVTDKIRDIGLQNKFEEAAQMTSREEMPVRDRLRTITTAMNAWTAKKLTEETEEAAAAYQSAKNQVFAISVTSIALGLILALIIMRAVTRAIDRIIDSLRDNTNQVTSASQQIASSSEQLSQAATEQAASLEETAATIEQMNSMIQRNSENSRRTADLATTSETGALHGKEVVQEMISAIGEINSANTRIMNQVNDSNQQIADITKVIAEIGNKTKVINDIVFQTKLLSFNASVEAARAGEHGKGFAVVAEEVGNLAQMSGNAAKEISALLDGSIRKVESIVEETKGGVEKLIAEGRSKVDAGTKIAEQCGEVLTKIVDNIASVAQMSKEISMASEEQARGAQEIAKAMTQLDQVTQQNSASSEETASAAEELSSQAEVLRGVVQTLIVTIKGTHAQSGSNFASSGESSPKRLLPMPTTASRPGGGPPSKVIHLSPRKPAPRPVEKTPMKVAAGSDIVPSEHDPRFTEV